MLGALLCRRRSNSPLCAVQKRFESLTIGHRQMEWLHVTVFTVIGVNRSYSHRNGRGCIQGKFGRFHELQRAIPTVREQTIG